jgi:hypothetical protein
MMALTGPETFSDHLAQAWPERDGRDGSALSDLDRRLLEAHASGGADALSRLYHEASRLADGAGDRDRAAFFLTHAWIFALEAGTPLAETLRDRLRDWGRCA